MEKLNIADIKELFLNLKNVMLKNRDYLIDLDSKMGDSDLGLTMVSAFSSASAFAENYSENDVGLLFMKAGMEMAKSAPSTMGTLMGTGFMRGGKALKGKSDLTLSDFVIFWEAFVTGLMDRGKAKPGDKTIIDSLYPAMSALKAESEKGSRLYPAFVKAKEASEEGVEKAKTMIAQFGRAAYYQEKSATIIDPGTVVGKLLIETFTDYIKG